MTELRASPSAVTALGGQLDNVAADVGAVINGAPALSEVLNSHGTIGFPADFAGASEARSAAVGATKAVSEKLAETLRQAARAYERGDLDAAEKLKAQADRMAGGRGSGASNSAGGPTSSGAVGGQDSGMQAGGQMMGQFSQMAGQMMQGIAQPVQGIVQGLTQVPQQVMQGVQGIVQAATQGAAGDGAEGTQAPPAGVAEPDGAGAPDRGEKAPAQAGIMSEERMRELQGLSPPHRDEAPHGVEPPPSPQVHPRAVREM